MEVCPLVSSSARTSDGTQTALPGGVAHLPWAVLTSMTPLDAETRRCQLGVADKVRNPDAHRTTIDRTIRNRSSEGESGRWRVFDIICHSIELTPIRTIN